MTVAGRFDLNTETGEKTCSRCSVSKTAEDFGNNKAARDGLKYFCKDCVNRLQREWAQKNPQRVADARDRQRERRRKAYDLLREQEKEAEVDDSPDDEVDGSAEVGGPSPSE